MSFAEKADEMYDREPASPLEEVLKEYSCATTGQIMAVVLDNWQVLQGEGLLEEAFLDAWVMQ